MPRARDAQEVGPFVVSEILKCRRGSKGQPWYFLDYSRGNGEAVTNEVESVDDEADLKRESQPLKAADILGLQGPAVPA